MARVSRSQFPLHAIGLEGALATLAPAAFLFAGSFAPASALSLWRYGAAAIATCCCLLTAIYFLGRPLLAKWSGFVAIGATGLAAAPEVRHDPAAALLASVTMLSFAFLLREYRFAPSSASRSSGPSRSRQRARWSALAALALICGSVFAKASDQTVLAVVLASAVLISHGLFWRWLWQRKRRWSGAALLVLDLVILAGAGESMIAGYTRLSGLAAMTPLLLVLGPNASADQHREQWWEPLLGHPSRVLFTTFFGLCCLGTTLLLLPRATHSGIGPIDAAFTAVSAVCVTGLTVVDTPTTFTPLGQGLVLLLIQLGGLGIMTLTTVAMHAMGVRLSLRQERLLASMNESSHLDLVASLLTILRFTAVIECFGAGLLTLFFQAAGDALPQALWRGIFTSISAFCNAGFALQSDNLVGYQTNPLILHTVAGLIICGGLAPATSLLAPRWLSGRPVPLTARIALVATSVLLLSGTLFFLAIEWNGVLAGLSLADKVHNAWFQSATLRTAGFNSVDIAAASNPLLTIMICLMFIGGSPGGTAGGIKTTTLGVLVLTFWASVTGRNEIIVQNRRVAQETINRAITVAASGFIVLSVISFMLETTQQISARELIFEATSALGTVGLTIGATAKLDDMGKIIVMLAMFTGRIGPMTLFMLLGEERQGARPRYPETRVTLT